MTLASSIAPPPSILIVDDDQAIVQGVATLLEQAGFRARRAYSAAEARALLAQLPDLVVLDLSLPDADGLTVCQHIRQLTPYIPILMLSARDEVSDKVLGLELGADEYVTKPFEPRELLARIRALLRFAEQRAGERRCEEQPLTCGPIVLWRAQHRVEVEGALVELTPREWALLELLMEHPGQVFGRETLLRRVWGTDFLGDSRVVDVHVQRLRAKLEVTPTTTQCIQTVRGFGYRLAPPHVPAPAPS